MKGKNKHNQLKPMMKKSMLAALGLGIAMPLAGSLPPVQAGALGPSIEISGPVLNDGIQWLSRSSLKPDPSLKPIVVANNKITIDLSTHFPSEKFSGISAVAQNANVTDVRDIADVFVNNNNELVITPYKSGVLKIKLQANYIPNQHQQLSFIESESQNNMINPEPQEIVTDHIELHISKRGDLNGDDKVDSADAALLHSYLRNMLTRRGFSYVEMNQADVDRNGEPELADLNALLRGYANKSLGAKDSSYVFTFKQVDDAPYALNGKLYGDLKVGATLASNIEFYDPDGDTPRSMLYQWYRGSEASGVDKTEIIGATEAVYKITAAEQEKYLFLQVTPQSYSSDRPLGNPVVIRSESTVAVQQNNIVSLTPSNGSTKVHINGALAIKYNRPVKINMNSDSSVIIRNLTTDQIEASYMVSRDTDFLVDRDTIYISNPGLKYGANYSIEIPNDAFIAKDDNAYMQGTVVEQNGVPWTFTTQIPQ